MTANRTSDVVVVGGGIAGASAAWALARTLDVVLVELEAQPGFHATGRSAALITETYGLREVCALASASRSFLSGPPPEVAASSLLAPRGMLWVASERATGVLDEVVERAAAVGATARPMDPDRAAAMVPVLRSDWVAGAVHEPDAMTIDVARLLDGYVAGMRHHGGELRLSSPAIELTPAGAGWRVRLSDGSVIECTTVVNAAGAWADELAARAGVDPVGLQPLLRTAFVIPWPDASEWPLVMDAGGEFYFEPEGPGLLVSPSDETPSPPCDARPDELAISRVVDSLASATTLEVRGVRHMWAGLRTFAPDRLPVVGHDPDAPGFVWLAGQGGAGIKTSPALAELTATIVTGDAPPAALRTLGLSADSFSPARLRHGTGDDGQST